MADPTIDAKTITLQSDNPYHFAAKRFSEMSGLINVLKAPRQTKLAFQTLPKHMRRRAATQSPKRLPKRLRATHTSQFKKSGTPVKTKRPTRKFRRKPVNLRREYALRTESPKSSWLETHLWHAKRFHMVSRWGYKLPWSPCDKSYRACYRATSKYCLIQDMSYLNTVQVCGPIDVLKEAFRKISSIKCGPTLNAKSLLSGTREGETYLFAADQYPLGCLGRVSFFWLPSRDDVQPTVWFFVHPAIVDRVKQELVSVLQLEQETKTFARAGQIELRHLERSFNRFRLAGPLAHSVVKRTLKVKALCDRGDFPLHAFLKSQEAVQDVQQQFWVDLQKCDSVEQVPSNMILSLVVEDPRLNRSNSKLITADQRPKCPTQHLYDIPDHLNVSPLFHPELLESIQKNVMTQGQYAKARNASCVVPGERCKFEDEMQACPILLIQRPGGSTRLGFNSGWDVIVPKGYGASFWVSFIMWGARAGGLREDANTQREMKRAQFEPDTEAGQAEAKIGMVSAKEAYFRRPFNKRPNYIKLAIASPFLSPWRQLTKEWEGQPDRVHVIRDRVQLESIHLFLNGRCKNLPVEFENSDSALVPITFRMTGRGNPSANSIICLPEITDNVLSKTPVHTEPSKKDPFEVRRKKCRKVHLQLLAKMRRKRQKVKHTLQMKSTKKVTITKPMSEKLISDQHRRMCELWLPSTWKSIRRQCSRETMGYCTTADFSFVDARTSGTGYVTLKGLAQLAALSPKRTPNYVLVRDPKSRQYRSATIGVMNMSS